MSNWDSFIGIELFICSVLGTIVLPKVVRLLYNYEDETYPNNYLSTLVTISAPGKVLIAGGYLVLEQPNIGLSIAATARFYSTISTQQSSKISNNFPENLLPITVISPQFYSQFHFAYDIKNEIVVQQIGSTESKNVFIEKCLLLTLSYIKQCIGEFSMIEINNMILNSQKNISIKLRADNDFYSQIQTLNEKELPLLSSSLHTLSQFLPCPKGADGNVIVSKTGMGSSAALTTSLVGALLQWFGVVRLGLRASEVDRMVIHNLAQLVHANAQGKIGSGFDVSTAVYGTQRYCRFSSEPFQDCLEDNVSSSKIYKAVHLHNDIQAKMTNAWNQSIVQFSFPPGIDLVMGDVCGGSSSTSMAKDVLRWKKEDPIKSNELWSELGRINQLIFDHFQLLINSSQTDSLNYLESIAWASETHSSLWANRHDDVIKQLIHLRNHFKKARKLLKTIGIYAKVDIEPDSQTLLVDATEDVKGVLAAGVPGAGGNDAIFALILSDNARESVENAWQEWSLSNKKIVVCPLMLTAEKSMVSCGVMCHFDSIPW
eukprot:gene14475-19431_t